MIHASLFSGIGGPEIAAIMMGWQNAFHCEINHFCRDILNYWFPESESYEDIKKTDFTKWRGKIDVLTGGFPCQPFSYAGRRGGRNDERYLWPQMLRAINEIRPAWVVCENVVGISTMVEGGTCVQVGNEPALFRENNGIRGYEFKQTFTLERICKDFESIGYEVQPMLIPACAVGAPHRRDRIFVIAYASSDGLHGNSGQDGRTRYDNFDQIRIEAEDKDGFGFWRKFRVSREQSFVAYPNGTGFQAARPEFKTTGNRGICEIQDITPKRRWKTTKAGEWLSSVSAIHRRNDGIPFDVDYLSIPFKEWREESLKAYGNAIVPQVMFRIFQAIEQATPE